MNKIEVIDGYGTFQRDVDIKLNNRLIAWYDYDNNEYSIRTTRTILHHLDFEKDYARNEVELFHKDLENLLSTIDYEVIT